MGRKSKLEHLTAEQRQEIIRAVRDGAFPYVAAKAYGIPKTTWFRWAALAERRVEPYRAFWDMVQQAAGEARMRAEVTVKTENPLAWLRWGPGRERGPEEPGWTGGLTAQVQAAVNVTAPDDLRLQALDILAAEIKMMPDPLKTMVIEHLRRRRQEILEAEVAEVEAAIDKTMPVPPMLSSNDH